jgi:hypothetical protein
MTWPLVLREPSMPSRNLQLSSPANKGYERARTKRIWMNKINVTREKRREVLTSSHRENAFLSSKE